MERCLRIVWGMSTKPRHVVPGFTYLITRRCTQRQFLLQPSELVHGNPEVRPGSRSGAARDPASCMVLSRQPLPSRGFRSRGPNPGLPARLSQPRGESAQRAVRSRGELLGERRAQRRAIGRRGRCPRQGDLHDLQSRLLRAWCRSRASGPGSCRIPRASDRLSRSSVRMPSSDRRQTTRRRSTSRFRRPPAGRSRPISNTWRLPYCSVKQSCVKHGNPADRASSAQPTSAGNAPRTARVPLHPCASSLQESLARTRKANRGFGRARQLCRGVPRGLPRVHQGRPRRALSSRHLPTAKALRSPPRHGPLSSRERRRLAHRSYRSRASDSEEVASPTSLWETLRGAPAPQDRTTQHDSYRENENQDRSVLGRGLLVGRCSLADRLWFSSIRARSDSTEYGSLSTS